MRQYYQQAGEIIADITNSNHSVLLIAGSGSGKSITARRYLDSLDKTAKVYAVVANEEDMDKNCVEYTIFDPKNPGIATTLIDNVAVILSDRLHQSYYRKTDFPPVRLMLYDWGSVSGYLQANYPALWRNTAEKLSRIVSLGRRFNVSMFADIQHIDTKCVGWHGGHPGIKIIVQGGFGDYRAIINSLDKFCKNEKTISEAREELVILQEKVANQESIICRINSDSVTFGIVEQV